jgi:hypothetical protein
MIVQSTFNRRALLRFKKSRKLRWEGQLSSAEKPHPDACICDITVYLGSE